MTRSGRRQKNKKMLKGRVAEVERVRRSNVYEKH
jgi:hypothetical protein